MKKIYSLTILLFSLQINAGYKIGFIDALNTGKKNATVLNETVSLG